MQTTHTTQHTEQILAFDNFLHILFEPIIPYLADACGLSINAVEKSLPYLLKLIGFQLLQQTDPTKADAKNLSELLKNDELTNLWIQNQVGFECFSRLKPFRENLTNQLFPTNYFLILGYLIAKTNLPKDKLNDLFLWVNSFSLKWLSDLHHQKKQHGKKLLNEKQMAVWREYQQYAMVNEDSESLLQVIDLKINHNLATSQAKAQAFAQQPQMLIVLQHINTFIETNVPQKQTTNTTTVPQNNMLDIFAPTPTPKQTWIDILQKYWIATAVALTTLIVGGMGLLTPKKDINAQNIQKTTTTQATNKAKQYNDVAIMKIASTPDDTGANKNAKSTQTTKPTDKPTEKVATQNKNSTAKTEKNNNDNNKTTKEKTTKKSTQAVNDKKSVKQATNKTTDTKKSDTKKTDTKKPENKQQSSKQQSSKQQSTKQQNNKKESVKQTDKKTQTKQATDKKDSKTNSVKQKLTQKTDKTEKTTAKQPSKTKVEKRDDKTK